MMSASTGNNVAGNNSALGLGHHSTPAARLRRTRTLGTTPDRLPSRDREQHGHAVSVLVLVVVPAIMLLAGLVIGGQRAEAASRAESVAAGAARAAGNQGITAEFGAGSSDNLGLSQARKAAQDHVQAAAGGSPEVTGEVHIQGHNVRVHTEAHAQTIFLSLIGIDTVTAHGSAQAEVVAVR